MAAVVLTVLAAVLFALGWVAGWVGVVCGWILAALRVGWADAHRRAGL